MSATLSLPTGWVSTRLGDCTQVITKGTTPTTYGHEYQTQGIRFVKVENLSAGRINQESIVAFIDEVANAQLVRSQLKVGDVLFSIAGTIGRTAIVRAEDMPANTNQAVAIIRGFAPLLSSFFLRLFLESATAQQEAASRARGGAMNNVSLGDVANLLVPVPPPREQVEIVAEIEKQFTRLDAAVAALNRVQANLKRYRAAVLKAACEGRLVPAEADVARKEGRSYETGEQLLARILEERRAKWEADQFAKIAAAGKALQNDEWKKKYKEPEAPDTSNLPTLPEGWTSASPDQLSQFDDNAICAGPFGTIFKAKDFRARGIPIIFLRHVAAGRYLTHKPGFMDMQKWETLFRPYSVFGGELLITKLGEPPGVCAIYPENAGPAMVTPDVIKMSVNEAAALPKFLMHSFNSDQARQFSTGACFGTTRLRLTLPLFRRMPVSLPPLAEQGRILTEVERQLSDEEALTKLVDAQLFRADRLRKSLLKSAFEGKLVPQDPNDEPASALLERVRAERERKAAKEGNLRRQRQRRPTARAVT